MASTLKNNPISIILITSPLLQLVIFTFGVYFSDSALTFVVPMIALALISVFGIYYLMKKRKEERPWEKIFLYLVILLVVCIICLNPPMMVPDEYAHFYRAYSLASGELWAVADPSGELGNFLPENITPQPGVWGEATVNLGLFRQMFFENFSAKTAWCPQGNTLVYFPLVYLPQALGVLFANMIGMSVYWVIFFGRLFAAINYCAMCYYAIKFIKTRYKPIMLFAALLPMALYEGCSFATDSVVSSAAFLFIGICFCEDIYKNSKKLKWLMYALGFVVVLGKFTYFPIMLLPWLGALKDKKAVKENIIYDLALVFAIAAWNIFIMLTVKNIGVYDSAIAPVAQVKFIFTHFFAYLAAVFRSMILKLPTHYAEMFYLGWFDHLLLSYLIISPVIILYFSFARTPEDELFSAKAWRKIFVLLIIIATMVLIATALYISWTAVGASAVEGVQGRYLIPLVPLVMIFMKELFPRFKVGFKKTHERTTAVIAAIAPVYMVVYLGVSYWIRYINL